MKTKILLVVGTQFPFARLLNCIEEILENEEGYECLAQALESKPNKENIKYFETMMNDELEEHASSADLIVGHLGVGAILLAKKLNKPIICMARLFENQEHRNDHQEKSVEYLSKLNGVEVVSSKNELYEAIRSYKSPEVRADDNNLENFKEKLQRKMDLLKW